LKTGIDLRSGGSAADCANPRLVFIADRTGQKSEISDLSRSAWFEPSNRNEPKRDVLMRASSLNLVA